MYAVIKTDGKQYRVQKGDILNVEKITLSRANQKTVKFEEILFLNDDKKMHIGTPTVKDAVVEAKILENGKSEKIIVYKYKAKKDYRRKQGHRQPYTRLEITKVEMKAPKKAASADAESAEKATESKAKTTKAAASTAKKTTTATKAKSTTTATKKAASTAKAKTTATKAKTTATKKTTTTAKAASDKETKE